MIMNFPCGPVDWVQLVGLILFVLLVLQSLLGIGLGIGFLLQPPLYNTVINLNAAFNRQAYFSIYARKWSVNSPASWSFSLSLSFSSYSSDHRQWPGDNRRGLRHLGSSSTSLAISDRFSGFPLPLHRYLIGCVRIRFRLLRSTSTNTGHGRCSNHRLDLDLHSLDV